VSIVSATLDRPATDWITVMVSVTPAPPPAASDYRLSEDRTLAFASGGDGERGVVTSTGAVHDDDGPDRLLTITGRPETRAA
jgi:hypothetical protein